MSAPETLSDTLIFISKIIFNEENTTCPIHSVF
jgi:hypothetical protein